MWEGVPTFPGLGWGGGTYLLGGGGTYSQVWMGGVPTFPGLGGGGGYPPSGGGYLLRTGWGVPT